MDVVIVATDLFKLNVITFADCLRNLDNGERDLVGQQSFAVFDRKDDVVVGVIDIVVSMDEGHASHYS